MRGHKENKKKLPKLLRVSVVHSQILLDHHVYVWCFCLRSFGKIPSPSPTPLLSLITVAFAVVVKPSIAIAVALDSSIVVEFIAIAVAIEP